jgi:hypothetical protein
MCKTYFFCESCWPWANHLRLCLDPPHNDAHQWPEISTQKWSCGQTVRNFTSILQPILKLLLLLLLSPFLQLSLCVPKSFNGGKNAVSVDVVDYNLGKTKHSFSTRKMRWIKLLLVESRIHTYIHNHPWGESWLSDWLSGQELQVTALNLKISQPLSAKGENLMASQFLQGMVMSGDKLKCTGYLWIVEAHGVLHAWAIT